MLLTSDATANREVLQEVSWIFLLCNTDTKIGYRKLPAYISLCVTILRFIWRSQFLLIVSGKMQNVIISCIHTIKSNLQSIILRHAVHSPENMHSHTTHF
jgi:hypothetical protein